MNKLWVGGIFLFIVFVGIGFATFKLGLAQYIEGHFEHFRHTTLYSHHRELINVGGVGLIATFFTVLGFFVARIKGRNPVKWAIICCLLNFWALITLLLLPTRKPRNGG